MSGKTAKDAAPKGEKECPECAEHVKDAAKVCRFCGYRFDLGVSSTEATAMASAETDEAARLAQIQESPKSRAGACILSLVIPGLGHFYAEEVWRGVVFLAAFLIAALAAIITDTVGPGFLIGIAAAIDGYYAAEHYNETGTQRQISAGVWLILLLVILAAAVGISQNRNESDDFSSEPDYQLVPCATNPDAIGC